MERRLFELLVTGCYMSQKGNNRTRILLRIILWSAVIVWLLTCLYLSWQTGEETAGLSWRIAQFLLELLNRIGLKPDAQQFHTGLRLFAHFGIFFITGFLVSGALEVSLSQRARRNPVPFLIAVMLCSLVAILAEVGKLGIPGRHLTWSEAALNVVGIICGAVFLKMIVAFVHVKNPQIKSG